MTSEYTFVAPERQNELTRKIQQKLAEAAKQKEPERAELPPAPPPTPEAPPSLADGEPVTLRIQ
jgi:hypothetical protein